MLGLFGMELLHMRKRRKVLGQPIAADAPFTRKRKILLFAISVCFLAPILLKTGGYSEAMAQEQNKGSNQAGAAFSIINVGNAISFPLGDVDSQATNALVPASQNGVTPALSGGDADDAVARSDEAAEPLQNQLADQLRQTAQNAGSDGTETIAESKEQQTTPVLPAIGDSDSSANDQKTDANSSPSDNSGPSESSGADATVGQAEETARQGPKLRDSFSSLYTEQRPFLLYAQDASITYLMPRAVISHPKLGRALRSILEGRALEFWNIARKAGESDTGLSEEARPGHVLNSRIEDKFYSSRLSSLFLKEDRTLPDNKKSETILSFNYDLEKEAVIHFKDLFSGKSDKDLEAVVALISAYIQADIVRQKSIRLGAQIAPDQDAWLKEFKPDADNLDSFTLVPARESGKIAGLTFHFNAGLLGAASDGSYAVFVPASIFSANLAEDYASLFEGDAIRVSTVNSPGFTAASIHLQDIKPGAELGGPIIIEGEVPSDWCDGFHLTLASKGEIAAEANIELLPKAATFGLSSGMVRFRAEMTIDGEGGKAGELVFEPYELKIANGRVMMREGSVCDPDRSIALPNPAKDTITLPVTY